MKFYAVVLAPDLPGVHRNGLPAGTSVTDDIHEAEDRAWKTEGVILEIEIEDPDALLAPDTSELEHWSEMLRSEAEVVPAGEIPPQDQVVVHDLFGGETLTWREPALQEEAVLLARIVDEGSWQVSIEGLNWAETTDVVLPDYISLVGPVDFTGIEDEGEFRAAVEAMEPVGLKSLGAGFWVWLMLFISRIFGPGYEETAEAAAEERAAEKAQARKARRKKRPKRKMAGSRV